MLQYDPYFSVFCFVNLLKIFFSLDGNLDNHKAVPGT